MVGDCAFSGNGDAYFVRAQAGRFSYAYYAYFVAGKYFHPDISGA